MRVILSPVARADGRRRVRRPLHGSLAARHRQACPVTWRALAAFFPQAPIARHTITPADGDDFDVFHTELAPIHRQILKLLRVPTTEYRA